MKFMSLCVGLAVLMTCSMCVSELVSAQGMPAQGTKSFSMTKTLGSGRVNGGTVQMDDDGYRTSPRPGSEAQQRSSASVTTNRSVSFVKNGKKVSINENASGISVTVDGKRFQAKNPDELKKRYPDAYRLYDEGMGNARISSGAFAGGSASAGGSAGPGLPGKVDTHSSESHSVSVIDNGKKITITQNETGITVSVNGKQVRAKNAAELKLKFPDAFSLYEKHLGKIIARADQPSDASALLREELNQLRDENADNPQLRNLIESMMRNVAQ